MGKKNTGVNTKVAAATEKQAQIVATKGAKAKAAEDAAEAREWVKGSNARGAKRDDESARKQDEKAAKSAAKKALEVAEENELKSVKVVKAKKKADIPPWEAALGSSTMSNKEKKRQEASKNQAEADATRKAKAERARAEAKALKDAGISMVDDTDPMEGSANPNRKNHGGGGGDGEWASGIDAALGSLRMEGGGGSDERHPEKRVKAALLAFEEMELPGLKEEKPGLKLQQYKQMIFEKFQKSPENPVYRARAAEAAEAMAAAAAGSK